MWLKLQRLQHKEEGRCALVNEGEAIGYSSGAIQAQKGQAKLVQQPLQHIQHRRPLAEDQWVMALRLPHQSTHTA